MASWAYMLQLLLERKNNTTVKVSSAGGKEVAKLTFSKVWQVRKMSEGTLTRPRVSDVVRAAEMFVK